MNWYKKNLTSESNSGIIPNMRKTFYIMRGMPGSGKSFLAKQLAGKTGQIFTADDFFIDEQGNYNWDADKIGYAHQWNHDRTKAAINKGISPVILDNTNVSKFELRNLKPLIEYALSKEYETEIKEPNTSWAFNPEELAKRNTHGLSQEQIEGKLRKWVPDVTTQDILNYENKKEENETNS